MEVKVMNHHTFFGFFLFFAAKSDHLFTNSLLLFPKKDGNKNAGLLELQGWVVFSYLFSLYICD